MAKKKDAFIQTVKGPEQLRHRAEQLRKMGYSILLPSENNYLNMDGPRESWSDFIGAQLRSGASENGRAQRKSIPTLYFSSGNEVKTGVSDKGTKDLGYIEWGLGNTLPNLVALLTNMLPYTAAGVEFNQMLVTGLGPQPKFDVAQYVGGNITTTKIRYKDAGKWLRGRIIDLQRELLKLHSEHNATTPAGSSAGDEGVSVLGGSATEGGAPSASANQVFDSLCESISEQIEDLQKALKKWNETWPKVKDFLERNNLAQTWLAVSLDQVMFNISFPELQLNQRQLDKNNKDVETKDWTPAITGLSYRSCHTTRLERMDQYGRINYVYCSNRWLDKPWLDQGGDQNAPINALHALNPASPLTSLQEVVWEAKEKNVSVNKRPTRFVLPTFNPTAGRPYYPTPAWHSIFGGDIYEYLSTIISDRYNRKKNSNIIGRIIYLHNDYMQQLFIQKKAQSDRKKQAEIRDKLYTQINQWLSNRDNAGQSLLAFTFMGTDGEEHKSFEIVEIESASKSVADANEKETAEISSIVFMALGLDARLLGSSPMALVGSSGGTDIRERYLLRLILKSPIQNVMLKTLDVVSHFNEWDENLCWEIDREVMTTLDRSKSGVTTQDKPE